MATLCRVRKTLARSLFRLCGYDVLKVKHSPYANLLGLRNYDIRSILDIGANIGQFARQMRSEFPRARVYCFEPVPEPFEKLSTWASRQNGAVTVHNVAIGDEPGTVEMFHHVRFSQSSSILPTTETSHRLYEVTRHQQIVNVEVVTLDDIVERLDPPPEPELLVKSDVQGYEDRVIRGGTATLRRARACVVEASLDPLYEGQAQFEQLVTQLTDLGLKYAGNLVQYCRDDGHALFVDALFLRDRRTE